MDKILEIVSGIRPEFNFKESNQFIGDGYLDSFDIVLLVSELETAFGITIDGLDIIPENFENLEGIRDLIIKNGGSL